MTLTLTLLALWTISTQTQDILYMDHLIAKSCVDRVGRLKFILGDNFQKSYTQLSQSIYYDASKSNQDVEIKIIFGDDEDNPLLTSDCISWSITQVKVDDVVNGIISWPVAKQEYLPALKATRIKFLIEKKQPPQNNLFIRDQSSEEYVALFELAFLVQSVTQYTYYFSVQVNPSSVVYLQKMISKACEGDRCLTQNAQARILQRDKYPPEISELILVPSIEGQGPSMLVSETTPLEVAKRENEHSSLNSQIKGIIQQAIGENQKQKFISPSQIEKLTQLSQKNKDKINTQSLLELSKVALNRNGKDYRLIPDKDPNDQSLDGGISSMDGSARANINKITMPNNSTQITAIAFSKQKDDINGLFMQTKIKKIDEQNDTPSQKEPIAIKNTQESEPDSNQQLNNLELAQRIQEPTEVALEVPPCDFSKFLMYRGACIPKQCLEDKLSRIILQSPVPNNEGLFSINLKNSVDLIPETLSFLIRLSYADQSGNEIVSDPISCIDWRLYMIANDYRIDSTRKYVVDQKVQWPSASYTNADNQSSVEFVIEQTDLERCIKLSSNGLIEWQCYFEFAFVLQEVTQVSYFMCIKVCLDTNIHSAVPEVNFSKIVQVDACPKDGVCSVQVHVLSQLDFCQDSTCSETAMEPYFSLYVNRPFWLRHRILNEMSNWRITQPTITYQAFGFVLTLNSNEVQVVSSQQGYNIYQLIVPIVADRVLITASGILASEGRILEFSSPSDEIVRAVHAVTSTGRVGDSVEALKELQLIEDGNQGYLVGMSILVCILTII